MRVSNKPNARDGLQPRVIRHVRRASGKRCVRQGMAHTSSSPRGARRTGAVTTTFWGWATGQQGRLASLRAGSPAVGRRVAQQGGHVSPRWASARVGRGVSWASA